MVYMYAFVTTCDFFFLKVYIYFIYMLYSSV